MLQDRWGHDVSTASRAAAQAYDQALVDMLENRLSMGERVKDALAADQDFIMGHVMRGYMFMQFGSMVMMGKVGEGIKELDRLAPLGTERERSHISALKHWALGHVHQARKVWEEIVIEYPADLLALRLHHFMSFWQGDRLAQRNVPSGVLAAISEDMPGYGFVLSMVAFGTEECGDYALAERLGRRAVEINGDDLWGIHAVAHVLEMQCRYDDGQVWLDQPFGAWADRNPFKDHVWWHTALYALELGQFDRVLDIYDREVDVDERVFYLDVQNAVSLLMRLRLVGVDVGDRWAKLAELAESRIGDHIMPFTDAHFMMALAGGGNLDGARAYMASQRCFAETSDSDAAVATKSVGLQVSEALLAYGEGNCAGVVEKLMPIRTRLAVLGGSHAQQDVFHQILIDAAVRGGKACVARQLLNERSTLRPNNAWTKSQRQALQSGA